MKKMKVNKLEVEIYPTRKQMGAAAAKDISKCIKNLLKEKECLNIIFAAAPSQNEVLESLIKDKTIKWNKINAFHMDEYINLSKRAPQGFANFLNKHIFKKVKFKSVNLLNCEAEPKAEAKRYSELLKKNPTDIVVMGIGENGHIAFNDPPVADFNDKKLVKIVKLDSVCRNQQVNDGCFKKIEDVPTHALTLTVPTLFNGKYLFCIVPAKTKADAVYKTLKGKIDESCPASILRKHKNAKLYLDKDSGGKL